jgi:glycosyltransferase involved in cell wall biosynthesis
VRVLLLHQNFPAQFRHLAPGLRAAGHEVAAIGNRTDLPADLDLLYLPTGGSSDADLRQPRAEERCQGQFAQGRRVARQLEVLARRLWYPDLVVGHPFWGDLLFLDDVFPGVPLVALMELDLLGIPPLDGRPRGAGSGLAQWTTLQAARRMAVGLTATAFQRSTFPAWLQPRIAVIHEGIDLQRCQPQPVSGLRLPDGKVLRSGEPTITFAVRALEPLRGFDTFLRALPPLLESHPALRVVICGEDRCCYGPPPAGGGGWKQRLLAELGSRLDSRRVLFTGPLPHASLLDLFRLSWAHVYLTAPFVLSWSLLEAMACGALLVASRTAPVQEVIEDGQEGLLVPFDDPAALTASLQQVLQHPARFASLRLAARRRILRSFDHRHCLARQLALLGCVARGEDPLVAAAGAADPQLLWDTNPVPQDGCSSGVH